MVFNLAEFREQQAKREIEDAAQQVAAEALSPFERFWAVCPKKVDKAMTRAKFEAITSEAGLQTRMLDRDSGEYINITHKATADELIAGMKKYALSQCPKSTWDEIARGKAILADGGKFTAHPSTFLNRGRWLDSQ